ncbi:uncharacterized protein LTR77_001983 [Saxophila tyrrhenica]|uniref:Uncharacterized protein n=1 Tax=Saxophila tyrrhenica TaxID=1690608 RepID=A0AAV9PH95_9PEZI|nr:hypothetical protein LTR77_001983 [Saxophila tyrrhenica]
MQLFSLFTTLLVAVSATSVHGDAMSNDWENAGVCGSKNANANAAIEAFCSKGDIVVPSKYAQDGARRGNMHARITGNCGGQWIPPEWCRAQFHQICAHGGPRGGGHRKYNGCQLFQLTKKY